MVTLKGAKQSSIAAATKAERGRDNVHSLLDYEPEHLASRANMARLRALRLAKRASGFAGGKASA